jgi:hypothetical protein
MTILLIQLLVYRTRELDSNSGIYISMQVVIEVNIQISFHILYNVIYLLNVLNAIAEMNKFIVYWLQIQHCITGCNIHTIQIDFICRVIQYYSQLIYKGIPPSMA